MIIGKLFNPKALMLVAAMPLAGCEVAGGIVAGVAAREAAEAAGADRGTANALGAAAALATMDALQQRQQQAGQCQEGYVATRGTQGSAQQEVISCTRTTQGYRRGFPQ